MDDDNIYAWASEPIIVVDRREVIAATYTCMTDGCEHHGTGRDIPLPPVVEGVVARVEPVCAGCLLPMMAMDGPYRAEVVNGRIVSRLR